jgi:hypothetical protein
MNENAENTQVSTWFAEGGGHRRACIAVVDHQQHGRRNPFNRETVSSKPGAPPFPAPKRTRV